MDSGNRQLHGKTESLRIMRLVIRRGEGMRENESHRKIREFIEQRGYSYNVNDILKGYQKRKDGYYNSYTMNDCLENLETEIEDVIKSVNELLTK